MMENIFFFLPRLFKQSLTEVKVSRGWCGNLYAPSIYKKNTPIHSYVCILCLYMFYYTYICIFSVYRYIFVRCYKNRKMKTAGARIIRKRRSERSFVLCISSFYNKIN